MIFALVFLLFFATTVTTESFRFWQRHFEAECHLNTKVLYVQENNFYQFFLKGAQASSFSVLLLLSKLKRQLALSPRWKPFSNIYFSGWFYAVILCQSLLNFLWCFHLACIFLVLTETSNLGQFLSYAAHIPLSYTVSCLAGSLFLWSSLRFGCWCMNCSLFHWSGVSSSELLCENSLFIICCLYNYHAGHAGTH